jgi:hypothetical protein
MKRHIVGTMLAALLSAGAAGCADALNGSDTTAAMLDQGIIYILPGIQGVDYHYKNIRRGLRGSGLQCAIKIHPWGCRIPGIKLAINETDVRDDRGWGKKIAQEIQDYQQHYPGRPIYMIGQSGGCAICVFTAELLASVGSPPLEGLVLLDASLSADYDLQPALNHCRKGIVNFYNLSDVALLEVGTEIFGNLDGSRGTSAGRTGFENAYAELYQVQTTKDMVSPFASPHFADTSTAFTARYIAPWIIDQTWPAKTVGGR